MKHLGDITKISGYYAPAVDIVVGGSPCQDLSVAGKRAGLAGERSGLYMEQIRIIKEMRQNDRNNGRTGHDVRPRYMVWENVPGAFSSNGGEDFRAVLEEAAKVADETAVIPRPAGGKWTPSGCILGNGWSVAWRVHDAQFWGVPQRRKRIALVADFGGFTAPEILFEREGLSGNTEPLGKEGKAVAGDIEASAGTASVTIKVRGGGTNREIVGALCAADMKGVGNQYVNDGKLLYNFTTGSLIPINEGGVAFSLLSRDYKDPQCVCTTEESCAFRKQGHPQNSEQGQGWEEASVNDTLNAFDNAESRTSTLVVSGRQVEKTVYDWHRQDTRMTELKDVCVTAAACWGGGGNNMPYVLEKPVEKEPILLESNQNHATIQTNGISTALPASMGMGGGYTPMIEQKAVVRRFTPLECERLQGYPDGWTDIGDWVDSKGKVHKAADSPRYKALGNSIALPFWEWLAGRMVECLKADGVTEPTMASLFDGIGGFPLVYSRCGCEPIWASEIEEFPIAVTKIRFPEETKGD